MTNPHEGMLPFLVQWGERNPLVRAMLMTSTRAIPNSASDLLSDYDVILALSDVQPFFASRAWLEDFGRVLVLYRDPLEPCPGGVKSEYVTQYESGLKIDFALWPVGLLRQIALGARLPDEFDAGYQVLLDKDHLTDGLRPPTFRAYIPKPPSQAEYLEVIECFLLEATYMAKYLWRDDLLAAKKLLEEFMRQEHLRPMLEWRVEIDHDWSVKTGPYGRGLKKWLPADLWAELETTWAGASADENWQVIDRMIGLMRRVAQPVGARLGYPYPDEMEQRTRAYIARIRNLEPGAMQFPAEP